MGGLFLLVYPNGSKYWRFKYRFLGKEKVLAIGVPPVTLAEARTSRDDAKSYLLTVRPKWCERAGV